MSALQPCHETAILEDQREIIALSPIGDNRRDEPEDDCRVKAEAASSVTNVCHAKLTVYLVRIADSFRYETRWAGATAEDSSMHFLAALPRRVGIQ